MNSILYYIVKHQYNIIYNVFTLGLLYWEEITLTNPPLKIQALYRRPS